MSTLSGIMSSGANFSPRAMMDQRIDSAVQSGKLSETDETALETALDAIDEALGSGSAASSSSGKASAKLNPSDMKDRIDSLIEDQVSSGTLTSDQASALQSFFAQGGQQPAGGSESQSASVDGVEGAGPAGGPKGMRGPPPPPPAAAEDSEEDDDSSTTTETTAADQLDAMIAFLENLREGTTSTTYGSSSTSSSSNSANSGLVVDTLA